MPIQSEIVFLASTDWVFTSLMSKVQIPADTLLPQLPLDKLQLRPMQAADLPFLQALYAQSRAVEMLLMSQLADEQKNQFLTFQFNAQHQHYQQHFPSADFCIIYLADDCLSDGVTKPNDIGRLYIERGEQEIRLVDITLIEHARGQGLGSYFLKQLIAEARVANTCISLHVEAENPAKRLYQRLGFVETGEQSFYRQMHWYPPEAS